MELVNKASEAVNTKTADLLALTTRVWGTDCGTRDEQRGIIKARFIHKQGTAVWKSPEWAAAAVRLAHLLCIFTYFRLVPRLLNAASRTSTPHFVCHFRHEVSRHSVKTNRCLRLSTLIGYYNLQRC